MGLKRMVRAMNRILILAGLINLVLAMVAGAESGKAALKKPVPTVFETTHRGNVSRLSVFRDRSFLILETNAAASINSPDLTMTRKVELWKPLLRDFFQGNGSAGAYTLAVGQYPEISSRMAILAYRSDEWNSSLGKARYSDSGTLIASLLNEAVAFPELVRLFRTFGYQVAVTAADGLLLCPPNEITAIDKEYVTDELPEEGRFPCGADLLFEIVKSDGD